MQESRQPNDSMIQFARSVLLRWFSEYDYDADEIELGEFDKLAACPELVGLLRML